MTTDEAAWMLGMSEDRTKETLMSMGLRPIVRGQRLLLWDVRDVYEARDRLRAAAGLEALSEVGHIV